MKPVLLVGLVFLALLTAIECAALTAIYYRYDYAYEGPWFFDRFLIPKIFLRPFMAHRYKIKAFYDVDFTDDMNGGYERSMRADPILGWRYVPNVKFSTGKGAFMTNPQGLLVWGDQAVEYAKPKPAGVLRVMTFGGSTMAGLGTWPLGSITAHLEKILRPMIGGEGANFDRLEVINAGVTGYYSANQLLYLITEMAEYEPDIVIFYDGWNDYQFLTRYYRERGPDVHPFRHHIHQENMQRLARSYSVGGNALLLLEVAMGKLRSAAWQLGSVFVMKAAFDKYGPKAPFDPSVRPGVKGAALDLAVARYVRNLRYAIETARIEGFSISLFLQPLMGVDGKTYSQGEMEKYDRIRVDPLREFYDIARRERQRLKAQFADRPDVCIKDLSRIFSDVKQRIYYDGGHLIIEGNRIVAEHMAAALVECNLVNDARTGS